MKLLFELSCEIKLYGINNNSIKYVNNDVILKSKYQNRTGNLSTFENCLAMFCTQIIKNNLIKSNILLSYKLLPVLQFAKNKQIMIHILLIAS